MGRKATHLRMSTPSLSKHGTKHVLASLHMRSNCWIQLRNPTTVANEECVSESVGSLMNFLMTFIHSNILRSSCVSDMKVSRVSCS